MQSSEPQTITIEDRYTLTLPGFLSEGDLHEDASLSYQNLWKEFYVIVIDEPIDELGTALADSYLEDEYSSDLDGYSSLILDMMNEALYDAKQSEFVQTTINGLPARLTTLSGEIDDIEIFYHIGLFEGQTNYYQVLTWTLLEQQVEYGKEMKDILHSLVELPM